MPEGFNVGAKLGNNVGTNVGIRDGINVGPPVGITPNKKFINNFSVYGRDLFPIHL